MQPLSLLGLLDRIHLPAWAAIGFSMAACVAVAAAFYYRSAAHGTTHE